MPSSGTPPARPLALLLACLLALGSAGVALAQDADTVTLDLPAQPLDQAVTKLARQAGLAIGGDAALLRGKPAPALKGEFTLRDALRRLLSGTGIVARFTNDRTVTLVRAEDGERLAPISVEAQAETAYGPVEGYRATRSATASRTDTPIREIPASVQVIPRDVIEEQSAQGLEDVYKNISGVVESGNTLNAQSEVRPVIRGFESEILLRNGMRATNVGAVDLANVERVEVLKGPSSILFGAIEPGGVLNYITKKPLTESAHTVSQQVGSYDHLRTTVDSAGSIGEGDTWLYRINGAYTNSDSFRDDVERESTTVAPSFAYQPSTRTELLFDFSFSREESTFDSGIPFGADNEPLVSEDTFFGDPELDGQTLEDTFFSYQLRHRINHVFTLRNQLQFHRVDVENETIRNRGVSGAPGSEMLGRRFQSLDSTEDEIQLVTDVIADFRTGGVEHAVLAGIDLVVQEQDSDRFRQNLAPVPISNDPPTDFTPPGNQPRENRQFDNEWVAVYVQDQLTLLNDRLHILVGGRYDDFHSEFEEDGVDSPEVDESEFTGRAGALFDLTDWAAPFVSISQSFNPQGSFAVDAGNNILPPEEGEQFEAGFKFNLAKDRVVATLAVFQIDKDNVAVFDLPTFLDTGEVTFTGTDQRSEGIELDVTGQINDRLSVIANYAHIDTEVLENPADPEMEGEELGNVAEDSARVWLAYDFGAKSGLSGLGIGGGLRYESERKAQFDDTKLDSFTIFDAGLWYRRPIGGGRLLRVQVNIENLTDEEFFPRASDQSIVHPGEPRSLTASVTLEF